MSVLANKTTLLRGKMESKIVGWYGKGYMKRTHGRKSGRDTKKGGSELVRLHSRME